MTGCLFVYLLVCLFLFVCCCCCCFVCFFATFVTVVYVFILFLFIFLPLQHFCTSVLQRYKYLLECESDVVSFSLIHGRKII